MANFISNIMNKRKAKDKSLGWIYNYLDRSILEAELFRRKDNREEVQEFLKEIFLTQPHSVELVEKISGFLGVTPMEVLEWDSFRLYSDDISERFLLGDCSWLSFKNLPTRVSSEFLLKSLMVNEQFYDYPKIVERLNDECKSKLFSYTSIDLTKFPKKVNLKRMLPDSHYGSSYSLVSMTLKNLINSLIDNCDYESVMILIEQFYPAVYDFEDRCIERMSGDSRTQVMEFIDGFPKPYLNEVILSVYFEMLLVKKDYKTLEEMMNGNNGIWAFQKACNRRKNSMPYEEYLTFVNALPDSFIKYAVLCENSDIQEYSVFMRHPIVSRLSFSEYAGCVFNIKKIDDGLLFDLDNENNEKFKNWKLEGWLQHRYLLDGIFYKGLFEEKSKEELLDYVKTLEFEDLSHFEYLPSLLFEKYDSNLSLAMDLTNKISWKSSTLSRELLIILCDKLFSEKDFETIRFILRQGYSYILSDFCDRKESELSIREFFDMLYSFPPDIFEKYSYRVYTVEESRILVRHPLRKRLNFFNYTGLVKNLEEEDYDALIEEKNEEFIFWLDESLKKRKLILSYKYYKPYLKRLSLDEIFGTIFWLDEESCEFWREIKFHLLKLEVENLSKETLLHVISLGNDIFARMKISSSSEIYSQVCYFFRLLLKSSNPISDLEKVEKIFLRNNLPFVGKIYKVFELMHPHVDGDLPSFTSLSQNGIQTVIFADLLKAALGSNNRSLKDFISNIENGEQLFNKILSKEISYDALSVEDKKILDIFCDHLIRLYYNTRKGKASSENIFGKNTVENVHKLKGLFSKDGSLDYSLSDRIVKMFCHFSGVDTLESVKKYMHDKVYSADCRNREASTKELVIKKGDMIKGLNDINYLSYLLQNGVVAKEFLNDAATSDSTPFDTDVSMVLEDMNGDIDISKLIAKDYGPIWIVLKKDDRFIDTYPQEPFYKKCDFSKLELFHRYGREEEHCGIRTGFSSSEIDSFLVQSYDPRIGLEIALNGFYIPVFNMKRKLVFSPTDYDLLRSKMAGLSYCGENNYEFSQNLDRGIDEAICGEIKGYQHEVANKRKLIYREIGEVLSEFGLSVTDTITGKLDNNNVELCETGSSRRGTGIVGENDFDFMMRIDRAIFDSALMDKIKYRLLERFNKTNSSNEITGDGDFRLTGVQLGDTPLDIDITFVRKTNKINYSTDMCVEDRLETIRKKDEEKYYAVLANIVMAKKLLKGAKVYKSARSAKPQGGLGGVGVENWILQNGGSLYEAALSFIEASKDMSFYEFKNS